MKNRLLVLAVMIGVFFGAFPPVFGQFFFGIKAGGMFYQPNGTSSTWKPNPDLMLGSPSNSENGIELPFW